MNSEQSSAPCSCGGNPPSPTGHWSPATAELVAIGAAIGSNCMPCLKYHIDKAREVGVSDDDLARTVAMASKVKQTPARLILELADRQLGGRIAHTVDPQASCGLAGPPETGAKCCA